MARSRASGGAGETAAPAEGAGSAVGLIAARYNTLSAGHRRVADFILTSPHEAALMTLEALARATGVSKATVDRFGAKVGLSGFPELKARLRSELKEALRPVEEFADTLRDEGAGPVPPWTESIQEDLRRIRDLRPLGGEADFARSCALLAAARRVLFVGFGSSAFIAQYGAFCLSALRDGCEALSDSSGVEGVERKILDAGSNDVAVQIAFARYSRPTIRAAEQLHRCGVPLIGITDAEDAPIVPYATTCFVLERKSSFVLTGSGTGAVAVLEALLRGVAAGMEHEALSRRSARLTSLLGDAVVPPREGV